MQHDMAHSADQIPDRIAHIVLLSLAEADDPFDFRMKYTSSRRASIPSIQKRIQVHLCRIDT